MPTRLRKIRPTGDRWQAHEAELKLSPTDGEAKRYARHAAMNPRNRGCGELGFDKNSG